MARRTFEWQFRELFGHSPGAEIRRVQLVHVNHKPMSKARTRHGSGAGLGLDPTTIGGGAYCPTAQFTAASNRACPSAVSLLALSASTNTPTRLAGATKLLTMTSPAS